MKGLLSTSLITVQPKIEIMDISPVTYQAVAPAIERHGLMGGQGCQRPNSLEDGDT
jgi:hypothetical protein